MTQPKQSCDTDNTVDMPTQPETLALASLNVAANTSVGTFPAQPIGAPTIPGYVIMREIATGGMGRIYSAHDLTLDREVAIKTLLPGANACRFVMEAKITAKLPHPNIPPVYALGTLPDSTPWLAMKFIHGHTLGDLLNRSISPNGDLAYLIQVFEQIAQAVGFAHSRGIIHRDLKPLNVMVGEFGEVQVMDWGLAKEVAKLDDERSKEISSEKLQHTQFGTVVGTPGFMAPEQARGEEVDSRADTFALGAIMAMILTGQPAFSGTTVRESIDKAARGDLAEALSHLDKSGADAELIDIAKKCLAVSPGNRPVDGLAVAKMIADYRRGVAERLKLAETGRAQALVREAEQHKRRRIMYWSTATVIAVMLIGLGASIWQMSRAFQAEAKAVEERNAKDMALRTTERQLTQIETGIEQFAALLTGIDPKSEEKGGPPLYAQLRERAETAADKLNTEAVGDELAAARLQTIFGNTLRELGSANKAIVILDKALKTRKANLGVEHPDTLETIDAIAKAYQTDGKLQSALPLFEEVMELRKTKLGKDHPDTLTSMNNLAAGYQVAGKLDLALPLFKEVMELRKTKLGKDHPDTLTSMNNLALAYQGVGRLDLTLPLYEESLKLRKARFGADHLSTLTSMNNLAACYFAADSLDLALPLYEESLKLRKAKFGADHPSTLTAMNNLAAGYKAAGKLELALPMYEESLKLSIAKFGADHPLSLTTMGNLGSGYQAAGKLNMALPLFEEALKRKKVKLGFDHPETLTSMNNLASCYKAAGKLDIALSLFEETLKLIKAKLGNEHPNTLACMGNLGLAYCSANQGEKGAHILTELISIQRKVAPKDDPRFAGTLASISHDLVKCGQFTVAETMLRESLGIRLKVQPNDWTTFNTQSMLGAALLGQKKYLEAEPFLVQGYHGMKSREKVIPKGAESRLTLALDYVIQLYTETNKPDEVKMWQAEKDKLTKSEAIKK